MLLLAAVIFAVYLGPYVLISHYHRYQAPMVGMQSVFTFVAACVALEALPFGRTRTRDEGVPDSPSSREPLAEQPS